MGTLLVHLWHSATNDSQPLERMEISFIKTWQFPKEAIQRRITTEGFLQGTLRHPLFPKIPHEMCCLQRKEQGKMPFQGHSPNYENLARLF